MSSAELSHAGPRVIPDGFYHLRYGSGLGVGGMYMTAGAPRSQITVEALRAQPPGKTQIIRIIYSSAQRAYTLWSHPEHRGIAYAVPAINSPIIVSAGAPSVFNIVPVHEPRKPLFYRITIGGGSTRELAIGVGPSQITPPRLVLQGLNSTNVWQLKPLIRNAAGEVEEQLEEDVDEEFSDEE